MLNETNFRHSCPTITVYLYPLLFCCFALLSLFPLGALIDLASHLCGGLRMVEYGVIKILQTPRVVGNSLSVFQSTVLGFDCFRSCISGLLYSVFVVVLTLL